MTTDTEGEFVTNEADILRMFRQAKQQMAFEGEPTELYGKQEQRARRASAATQ